ncbi:MAG: hypothetical protein ACI97K_002713 [Glaciecola sp.]|jgi:hypothetical protein
MNNSISYKKTFHVLGVSVISALIGFSATSMAAQTVYTSDADFALGTLNSVNFDAPNSNQLQLSDVSQTFPVLWVANAGEDSLSKINTDTDCEDSRYHTSFGLRFGSAFAGAAPSRTAVDVDGNVYIANRHFDGKPAEVLKILAEGGVDRNGNGVIDTSVDTNGDCSIDRDDPTEFLLNDDTNNDGILQLDEIKDERVVWVSQVGANSGLGRSLCIGTDGNIWLGLYSSRSYYKLDASDGSEMVGPISTVGHTPYGCLVDREGILWSASLSSNIGALDTNTDTFLGQVSTPTGTYGIAIGNDKVYSGNSGRDFLVYDPLLPDDNNPLTGAFTLAPNVNNTLGINVDGEGNIVSGSTTVVKTSPDGTRLWTNPLAQAGFGDRGVMPDSNNNIWHIGLQFNQATKLNGVTGNVMAIVPVGLDPYSYSDATGIAARTVTDPTGIWSVVSDGGDPGTEWVNVNWNNEAQGSVPAGASITTSYRVANSVADLSLQTFQETPNGAALVGATGQYIEVRTVLRPNVNNESPVLSDMVVEALDDTPSCDLNGDGQVNRTDINLFRPHRNTPAVPGEPLDIDGNGVINKRDARLCVLECTNARCAI